MPTMTVNELMTTLVDELAAGDVPDVLAQSLTLAALWDDLARLNGEEPPRWVVVALGDAGDLPRPLPVRLAAVRCEEVG